MHLGERGTSIFIGLIAMMAVGAMGVTMMERSKTGARLNQSKLIEAKAKELARWLKAHLADQDFCTENLVNTSIGALRPNDASDLQELYLNGNVVLEWRELVDTGMGEIEITDLKFREIEIAPGAFLPYFTVGFDLNPNGARKLLGAPHRKMNFLLQGPRAADGSFNGFCFHDESTHVIDTLTTGCENFGGTIDPSTWACDHNLGAILDSAPSESCSGAMKLSVDSDGVGSVVCDS